MADGAYDGEPVSQAVLNKQPDAQVIIPPHKTAVVSNAGDTQRDRHIQTIAQNGRIAWQQTTNYNLRNYVELAMQRYKRIFGNTMKARVLPQQKTEAWIRCATRAGKFCSYIDDFVICFQYRSDAMRVQQVLSKRLAKFGLALETNKTKLVEFGRFADRHAQKRGRKRPETLYFLGFTIYCTRNLKGNYQVGFRTEKSRLRRSIMKLSELMRRIRHLPVKEQVINLNRVLRGHYAYYGIAGNFRALKKVYRNVERCWRKMLGSRNREGQVTWDVFLKIKTCYPLQQPKLVLPYPRLQAIAVL
jgi:hypothetical protein